MKDDLQTEILNQDLLEQMANEPLVIYFQLYHDEPIELLDEIAKIREGDEASIAKLAVSMYRFSSLYELFRPYSISHSSPYHGTVKAMDTIYATLSSVFGKDLNMSFCKYGVTTLDQVFRDQKQAIKDTDWERLENSIKYVSKMIDKTIAEHSLDNAFFYKFSHRSFFTSLITKSLTEMSDNVVLDGDPLQSIVIGSTHVSLKTNIGTIDFKRKSELRRKLWFPKS